MPYQEGNMSDQDLSQVTNGIHGVRLEDEEDMDLLSEEGELPNIVIVTGVADCVFDEEARKVNIGFILSLTAMLRGVLSVGRASRIGPTHVRRGQKTIPFNVRSRALDTM